jgi:acetyltransferase-like isoleucine patch superfamily enzyme
MGSIVNAGANVRIGRGSLIASHCVLAASFHGIAAGVPIRSQPHEHAPISVGEDVWLGAGAFVGKGVRIGDGAVVGAGAAVTGDVPPDAVVAGIPARAIGQRS